MEKERVLKKVVLGLCYLYMLIVILCINKVQFQQINLLYCTTRKKKPHLLDFWFNCLFKRLCIPYSLQIPNTPFYLLQLANGKWKRLSRYCPLDLFSGWVTDSVTQCRDSELDLYLSMMVWHLACILIKPN